MQATLEELRQILDLKAYDCENLSEVFDAVTEYGADCIWLDLSRIKSATKRQLDSLAKRLQEARRLETTPTLLLYNQADPQAALLPKANVIQFAEAALDGEDLRTLLLQRAQPTQVAAFADKDLLANSGCSFQYEWTGRNVWTEEAAAKVLFAEERFKRLINSAHDLICVIENDGFVKFVSSSSMQILGRQADELTGRYLQDFFPKCKQNNIQRWLSRSAAKQGFSEIKTSHTAGHWIYLETACVDMQSDPVVRGHVISARDVSARKRAEQQLSYQSRLLANIREAVLGLDTTGKVVYLNTAACRMYRTTPEQAAGLYWHQLAQVEWLHPDEEAFAQEALQDHGQWRGEVVQHLAGGRRSHVEVSITAHQDVLPGKYSLVVVVRDIKDRKVVESVLFESESRYRNLVSLTSDLVWHTDAIGRLTFISPKVSALLGYTASELAGRNLADLMDTAAIAERQSLAEAFAQQQPFSYLTGTFRAADGRLKYFEVSAQPHLSAKGVLEGYHGAIRDITERVEADHAIRQALAEKETLIKEIHHRVKNNMQIISSLLSLQSQFIKDPGMLLKLQESQDRIRSMALVHEKLYQSKNLSEIDFKDYLETLAHHISNSYREKNIRLSILMPAQPVEIGIDKAVPCGMIVNELLTNAYKHAFEAGQGDKVALELSVEDGWAHLAIADNGKGITHTDLEQYEATSLGMQLVAALIHQLRGKLEITNTEGSRFGLIFKL